MHAVHAEYHLKAGAVHQVANQQCLSHCLCKAHCCLLYGLSAAAVAAVAAAAVAKTDEFGTRLAAAAAAGSADVAAADAAAAAEHVLLMWVSGFQQQTHHTCQACILLPVVAYFGTGHLPTCLAHVPEKKKALAPPNPKKKTWKDEAAVQAGQLRLSMIAYTAAVQKDLMQDAAAASV